MRLVARTTKPVESGSAPPLLFGCKLWGTFLNTVFDVHSLSTDRSTPSKSFISAAVPVLPLLVESKLSPCSRLSPTSRLSHGPQVSNEEFHHSAPAAADETWGRRRRKTSGGGGGNDWPVKKEKEKRLGASSGLCACSAPRSAGVLAR